MSELRITEYTVTSDKMTRSLTFAVVADLHNGPLDAALPHMQGVDGILIVGDLVNRHRPGYQHAVDFLHQAPDIAPVFYSIGNHEWKFPQRAAYWPHVLESRVTVLDNDFVPFEGLMLGGFSSAARPDPAFLADFAAQDGFTLLMCHHPEYYPRYVADFDIDLTVAGHAHGGQVQLRGRGLYAPGQGLLPKMTHGFYDEKRLLVSRGMTNSTWAPRISNPCEMILLHLTKA
ncbi:MAG: metallophosphoesterase [Aristaeellaceae bacterium]